MLTIQVHSWEGCFSNGNDDNSAEDTDEEEEMGHEGNNGNDDNSDEDEEELYMSFCRRLRTGMALISCLRV